LWTHDLIERCSTGWLSTWSYFYPTAWSDTSCAVWFQNTGSVFLRFKQVTQGIEAFKDGGDKEEQE
jgi:hypothetical protein